MPAKGSSSSRIFGLVASPIAMPSARRWPCGRLLADLVCDRARGRGSSRISSAETPKAASSRRAAAGAEEEAEQARPRTQMVGDDDVVAHPHALEDRRLLEGAHDAPAGHDVRRQARDALALEAALRPTVGRRNDEISLNSVDLPAPFGPITDRISPSRTEKETSLTATSPPKRLVRPMTSSSSAMAQPFLPARRSRG